MKTPEKIKKGLEYLSIRDIVHKMDMWKEGIAYDYAEDAAADALAYIQQLEAQVTKWISVHDALPDMNKKVLFCPTCNPNSIYIGRLEYVGEVNAVYFAVRDGRRKITYSATHWMPLPERPKEDTPC